MTITNAAVYTIRFVGLLALSVLVTNPVAAQDPYTRADDTWISISGRVEDVTANAFTLDYGDGIVIVEMDDGDRDADAYKLMQGDKVRVNGLIDDDLFETTTIEASSVYVENIGTYFYASAADEEDTFVYYGSPIIFAHTVVQGTVTAVNDHEFTVDTGDRMVRIEVEDMPYDPLDDVGYQRIDVGDRVSVAGTIDHGFFEGRELVAETIVVLSD